MGELDKAIESYDSALKIDPTMDDALFNKQLIEDLKNRQNQNQEGNQSGSESDQENTSQNDTKDSTSGQENESNNQDESNSAEQTTNNQIDQKEIKKTIISQKIRLINSHKTIKILRMNHLKKQKTFNQMNKPRIISLTKTTN